MINRMADVKRQLKEVVEILEKGGGYGSVMLRQKTGSRAVVTKEEESVNDVATEYGAVLSLFDGHSFHELAVDSQDQVVLLARAKELADRTKIIPGGLTVDPGPNFEKQFETKVKTRPESITPAQLLDQVRSQASDIRSTGPLMVNYTTQSQLFTEQSIFVNRSKFLEQKVHRVVSHVVVFVHKNGETRDFFDSKGGTGDISLGQWHKSDIQTAYDTAALLLGTKSPSPGLYTVAGSSHLSGLLAHEGFGHNAEIDMMLKNRSKAQQYLGKSVGSHLITIIDDPTLEGGYGSYFFDDNGTIATPTVILNQGVFATGLADLSSALQLKQPITANARRESYQRKAYARMSNTFFKPGASTRQKIIESIDDGIYLDRFQSGMEDPKGWGIQIKFSLGREIKNGKLTGKIYSPIGLTGYVPDILGKISMIAGDDFATEAGGCGKGHKEWVPNGTGGVSIKTEAYLG